GGETGVTRRAHLRDHLRDNFREVVALRELRVDEQTDLHDGPLCARSGMRSVAEPGGGELKILQLHLLEERLVLLLRQRPQDRRRLVAGVPVLAAANPDGPGKSGTETGEEFLGRSDGRCGRSTAGARLRNQPHDAADLLLEAQRHRHVVHRAKRPVEHVQVREAGKCEYAGGIDLLLLTLIYLLPG